METVAILLAAYNGEKYIAEQLDSLLAQTYTDFVCYIHDDGSKDKTFQICLEYANRIPDKFVMLDYPPTGSAKNNFFSMMRYPQEDYIMFCDQDDIWLPVKIENTLKRMKELEQSGKCTLVFSDLKVVHSDLSVIAPSYLKYTKKNIERVSWKDLLPKGFMPGCAFMLNRQLVDKILTNSMVDYEKVSMHDWWAVLVNAVLDGILGCVEEPLMLYRQHDMNCVGVRKKTLVQAIIGNVGDFLSGKYVIRKKSTIRNYREQANQLLSFDEINEDKKRFIQEFVNIGNKTKIYRMWFYVKNFHDVAGIWRMILWV